MLATDRYIDHLLILLNDRGNPEDLSTQSENDLKPFLKMIAVDRIRIGPTDWKGYTVSSLLWNLPNLKKAGKMALTNHVRKRWQDFSASFVPRDPAPPTAMRNPREPQHTGSPVDDESGEKKAVEIPPPAPSEPPHVLTRTVNPRRDWFDRLTDWVAALVTLWK
jgi:hypothetical protein